jgi:hypothetical protein
MKNLNIKLIVAAVSVLAASSAFAEVAIPKGLPNNPVANDDGYTSVSNRNANAKQIYATVGTEGEHKGKASLYVYDKNAQTNSSKGLANNKSVSFEKIDRTASQFFVKTFASGILGKDKNGVTVAHMYKMTGFPWNIIPKMPDHSHLGRMSYGKVGNLDVYYGDWDNTPSGAGSVNKDTSKNNYTVFYSGTGKTTNMPTSGTATYAVKGINGHYEQGTAVLSGDLKADFGKKTLAGTLTRTTGDLKKLGIDAKIVTSDASFSGKAVANGSVNGTTKGNFFGNNAAGLAGIAQFDNNKNLNAAFGGAKK